MKGELKMKLQSCRTKQNIIFIRIPKSKHVVSKVSFTVEPTKRDSDEIFVYNC